MSLTLSGAAVAAAVGFGAAAVLRDRREAEIQARQKAEERQNRRQKAHARRLRETSGFKHVDAISRN